MISTSGQKEQPASHAPGRSFRIFCPHLDSEKVPDCKRLAAKKIHVNAGPKNN
jgi:hypothetical protein